MTSELIFFGLGTLFSWGLTHYYYKKSNHQMPHWFNVKTIKDVIIKNPKDIDWTAKEIVKLYNNKIFDENDSSPFNWKVCPSCGSEKLKPEFAENPSNGNAYYTISCEECNCRDWTQA